jgi:hypothetical protein
MGYWVYRPISRQFAKRIRTLIGFRFTGSLKLGESGDVWKKRNKKKEGKKRKRIAEAKNKN